MAKKENLVKVKRKKDSKKMKNVFLILGILGIFLLFRFQLIAGEKKIEVVAVKHDVKAGVEIDRDTDLVRYKISRSDYESMNNQKNTDTGEKLSPVVLASEVEKLQGRKMCNFTPAGTIMRRDMATTESVTVNPWTNNIPDDKEYEIYTMDFDSDSVNTRLLVPGAKIRIRGILNVESQYADEIRNRINQKEKNIYSGLEVINEGESVIREFAPNSSSNSNNSLVKDVPVAEIIYPSIRVVDMLNSSDESIYDIYMSLLGMSYNQRMSMLQTSVTEKQSSFMKRVVPSKLVLVVSAEDASNLAEFEEMSGMNFKYTILPYDKEDDAQDLYSQLLGVSDSIYSFSESYSATSK